MKYENIDSVVKAGLCTRCGACHGACPQMAIEWDQNYFPHTMAHCDKCGICIAVCGGIGLNYPFFSKEYFGESQDLVSEAIGPVRLTLAACTTNNQIREMSSSGGLATQIPLSLMASKEIDGSVTTGFEAENLLAPTAKIAKSPEDILWGVQSKYVLFPVAHIYREIVSTPGRYLVVGLPCQIHSLIKWKKINSTLRERIFLTVGLCCHTNFGIQMLRDLLAVEKVDTNQVKKMEFRGGTWPGAFRVTLKNGSVKALHSGSEKDNALIYLQSLYTTDRCLLCPDYAADFADISVSDPWIRNEYGDYMFEGGWSIANVRTERGEKVIDALVARGDLVTKSVDRDLLLKSIESIKKDKKRGFFIRIDRRRRRGLPVPEFGLEAPRLSRKDYMTEAKFQVTLLAGRWRFIQLVLMRLFFSRFGEKLKELRTKAKNHKHH
ncbi:MAG: Coenzyme F420 hydrogenase/dehydrogenase, beta subunit C-terminal domain, partial [Syntrophorhabdus sp.]